MQLELFSTQEYEPRSGQQVLAPWGERYELLLGVHNTWWALSEHGNLSPCDRAYLMNEVGFVIATPKGEKPIAPDRSQSTPATLTA